MARIEVKMPKMGESITEGTIVQWVKNIGDYVSLDETLLEIATDKVDSEVPAPEAGVLVEILVKEGETVDVGVPIAILETNADAVKESASEKENESKKEDEKSIPQDQKSGDGSLSGGGNGKTVATKEVDSGRAKHSKSEEKSSSGNGYSQKPLPDGKGPVPATVKKGTTSPQRRGSDGRFYSPLVRAIAKKEGVSMEELESLKGSGNRGRLTREDLMCYLRSDTYQSKEVRKTDICGTFSSGEKVKEIKMDHMRKLIAEHMVRSKQTSAHVTAVGEVDLTRLVRFRERNKESFLNKYGFKLTFTPFFVEATLEALRDYPLLNSSVDGDTILLKREINYGVAVSLGEAGADGLVVPVIKNAGEKTFSDIAHAIHDLAYRARNKQLSPDDLAGGTFTFTNYGSVGNLIGTPIINQPQVAIFGVGMVQKRPVVMEVDGHDTIAIRQMAFLSMSYDHRIIDGAMGGAFMQRVISCLENIDEKRAL